MKKDKFSISLFGLDKKQIYNHLQLLKSDYEKIIKNKDEEIEDLREELQRYIDMEQDILEKREEVIQAMIRSQKEAKKIQKESYERLKIEEKKLGNIQGQIEDCKKEAIEVMSKYINTISTFDNIQEESLELVELNMQDAMKYVKASPFFEKMHEEDGNGEGAVLIPQQKLDIESIEEKIEDTYIDEEISEEDEIEDIYIDEEASEEDEETEDAYIDEEISEEEEIEDLYIDEEILEEDDEYNYGIDEQENVEDIEVDNMDDLLKYITKPVNVFELSDDDDYEEDIPKIIKNKKSTTKAEKVAKKPSTTKKVAKKETVTKKNTTKAVAKTTKVAKSGSTKTKGKHEPEVIDKKTKGRPKKALSV